MSKKDKLGPTGDYPHGMLGPTDLGALNVGVARDSRGNVIINFNTEVSWLGLPADQAINFARLILRHAGVKKVEIDL